MRKTIHAPAWFVSSALIFAFFTGGFARKPTLQTQTHLTQMTLDQGFTTAVHSAAPAVVNIASSRVVKTPVFSLETPFEEKTTRTVFGVARREHSLGSGVIVTPDGYVLTNHHVIEAATEVLVTLSDKRELTAKVIGSDSGTDVAVLKIDAGDLPSVLFADSAKVQVGDLALAIGNPFGLGRSVTMGIVGATGRGGLGLEDFEDFIQTDASINPGNSGGALTNVRGELIGLSTAILSPSGANLGIGFAIPSNLVRSVMDQIIRTGKVNRGIMGIVTQDLTPNLVAALKLDQKGGALVGDIEADGPGARAGVQPGDVILELNGKAVTDSREIRLTIGSMAPGSKVAMRLQRNGEMRNVAFALAESPEAQSDEPGSDVVALPEAEDAKLGVVVTELTAEIRHHLRIPETVEGIVVAEVQEGSPAAEAELHPGDVIQQLNQKPVLDTAEFRAEIERPKHGPLLLRIQRDGHGLFVAMK